MIIIAYVRTRRRCPTPRNRRTHFAEPPASRDVHMCANYYTAVGCPTSPHDCFSSHSKANPTARRRQGKKKKTKTPTKKPQNENAINNVPLHRLPSPGSDIKQCHSAWQETKGKGKGVWPLKESRTTFK